MGILDIMVVTQMNLMDLMENDTEILIIICLRITRSIFGEEWRKNKIDYTSYNQINGFSRIVY